MPTHGTKFAYKNIGAIEIKDIRNFAFSLHACMADGEISGSGIEIAGQVKISISKAEGFKLKCPCSRNGKRIDADIKWRKPGKSDTQGRIFNL
jgi:hypothetical protein